MSKLDSLLRLAQAVRASQKDLPGKRPPKRKPDGGAAQPAVSPRGPLPLEGGAAATVD